MLVKRFLLYLLCLLPGLSTADFSGNVGIETRYFANDGAYPKQGRNQYSISVQPEYRKTWNNGRSKFTFVGFARWDSEDDERTHADIRELDIILAMRNWEIQAGISKVFWGVAESQHLVDIINQTDSLEGVDGEDKLGQPMLRLSRLLENGSIDLYLLPYFRERTFPGEKGRFRTPLPVDNDHATYEHGDEEKHLDYAVRFSQTLGNLDIGLHWFDGTSRDPQYRPVNLNGKTMLRPHYSQIEQTGLDLQYTGDAWLWKLEAIHRKDNNDSYNAAVGGFEYTITGIAESAADLGLIAEYHYDSRDQNTSSSFQNDIFLGSRLTLNDADSTEVLAGLFYDQEGGARSFRLEASRRIGDDMKLSLESQWINHTDQNEPFHSIRQDDYIQIELQKYF